jgi:hypothetical protein
MPTIVKTGKGLIIRPPSKNEGLTADLGSEAICAEARNLDAVFSGATRAAAVTDVPNVNSNRERGIVAVNAIPRRVFALLGKIKQIPLAAPKAFFDLLK